METRTKRIHKTISQFKGKKRKYLELRIFNPDSDKWTISQIAKEVGCSRPTLYEYLQDPKLLESIRQCCLMMYANDMPTIVRLASERVKQGSDRVLELVHKATGLIDGDKPIQTVNIVNNEPTLDQEYASPQDALAAVEHELAQLTAQRDILKADIASHASAPNRVQGDGIHPEQADGAQDKT